MALKIFAIMAVWVLGPGAQGSQTAAQSGQTAAQIGQINGIVKDALSGVVIKNAVVVLLKARLADTTDPAGAFSFDKVPLSNHHPKNLFVHSPIIVKGKQILFNLSVSQPVSLVQFDLNGKVEYQMKMLASAGQHTLALPARGKGLHLISLAIGKYRCNLKGTDLSDTYSNELIFSETVSQADKPLAKVSALSVDTLHIYSRGYEPVFLPITNPVSTGLVINLVKPAFDIWQPLPNPDNKPVATGKPLKVFLQMGQSNMIGYGQIAPDTTKGTLAYLLKNGKNWSHIVDAKGAWTVRNDVWDVNVVSGIRKGWHTVGFGNGSGFIGPEFQFGHIMGTIHDEMVLLIKASRGNRALGWDALPPGSVRYNYEGYTYAGYKDSLDRWPADSGYDWARTHCKTLNPATGNCFVSWYAGLEYDLWVSETHKVLDNLVANFPGYNAADGYEIAGFTWFQGHRDAGDMGRAIRYETNLVNLIKALRKEFKAPNMKAVVATIGFEGWAGMNDIRRIVAQAQLNVGNPNLHPEFKDNVRSVESRDYFQPRNISPSAQDYHYYWNAELYYSVGNAMGWAMKDLLGK